MENIIKAVKKEASEQAGSNSPLRKPLCSRNSFTKAGRFYPAPSPRPPLSQKKRQNRTSRRRTEKRKKKRKKANKISDFTRTPPGKQVQNSKPKILRGHQLC